MLLMHMRIVRRDMSSRSTDRIALSDQFVIRNTLLVPTLWFSYAFAVFLVRSCLIIAFFNLRDE